MSFVSPAFFVFLPVTAALCTLLPAAPLKKALLLCASYAFYGWGRPSQMALLFGVTLFSYGAKAALVRTRGRRVRGWLLSVAVGALVGTLVFFRRGEGRTVPAGLSFYVFQAISSLVDAARAGKDADASADKGVVSKSVPQSLSDYALYLSFFPQLVAGPIETEAFLLPRITAALHAPFTAGRIRRALPRLILGYYKKLAAADVLAPFVDRVFASAGAAPLGAPAVCAAACAFACQIYADFSGYSDIARGSAALLGVELSENFAEPYRAASPREFWRRWHMSLNRWFVSYVYRPLGGGSSAATRVWAAMAVFLLSGLWHGCAPTFVLWGLYSGAVYCLTTSRPGEACLRALPRPCATLLTFALVTVGWICFRAGSLSQAGALYAALGHWSRSSWASLASFCPGGWREALRLAVAAASILPLDAYLREGAHRAPEGRAIVLGALALAALLAGLSGLSGGDNAFIYFQF